VTTPTTGKNHKPIQPNSFVAYHEAQAVHDNLFALIVFQKWLPIKASGREKLCLRSVLSPTAPL